jgi:hypothetical protein
MQKRILIAIAAIVLISSCASIPKETVTLSQTLGNDLEVLHSAHRNIAELLFKKIRGDINSFVDDTYAPYVIHFVLNHELQAYQSGKPSLYTSIELAGQKGGKEETEAAVSEMFDFQVAARKQIERKRTELLSPIINQETEIIQSIDQSYENAIYANSTITGYLQSIRKVKEAQQEALSKIGLSGADTLVTNTLVKVSEQVNEAVARGKEIDFHSENALQELDAISNEIKDITRKK